MWTTGSGMDKDSKGQRKTEDWQRATSCNGRTQPRTEQNRIVFADTVILLTVEMLFSYIFPRPYLIQLMLTLLQTTPPRWSSGKAPASRAEDPGFKSRLRRDFLRSSHTSDLKIGTPVATLPGSWRYRVSTGTGRPGVSIL